MGTYNIPRNLKGETRILVIFTVKSLITSAIGAAFGGIFWLIFSILGLGTVGLIMVAIFAVIGFTLGRFNIPTIAGIPFTKKIGGEPVSEVLVRYFKFKANRKVYVYTKEEENNG